MKTIRVLMLLAVGALIVTALPTANAHAAATIVINNADGAGEGFNDPTPVAPIGGNPGTTLGAQRLNAFTYAANIWAACLNSNVTIVVNAQIDPQFCSGGSAVLGSAGTTTVHRDFTGAQLANTWYPQALANAQAGSDLSPNPDINATFNSNLGTSGSCSIGWYYGYDMSPGGGQIDFISVVTHEIGHGLGFQTFQNSVGNWFYGIPDTYGRNMYFNGNSPPDYPSMSAAQRAAGNLGDPNLVWDGSGVNAQIPLVPIVSGVTNNRVRLHGPNPFQNGSSLSHFSTALFPNEMMEPSYTVPIHDPAVGLYLLEDIGWDLDKCSATETTVDQSDTNTVSQTTTLWTFQLEVTANGPGDAINTNVTLTSIPFWASAPDPFCAYGTINNGTSSFGLDDFTLDITNWTPGTSFNVNIQIEWENDCGETRSEIETVTLQPEDQVTAAGPALGDRLEQNFPNPFNPTTTINYAVAADGLVELNIYDVSGALVRTLVDETKEAGTYSATWNGVANNGTRAASGVYFYTIRSGEFTQTRRMVMLK